MLTYDARNHESSEFWWDDIDQKRVEGRLMRFYFLIWELGCVCFVKTRTEQKQKKLIELCTYDLCTFLYVWYFNKTVY